MRVLMSLICCLVFGLTIFAQQKKPLAPAFSISSIDGKTFDSEKLKGKIVVLNLWFINCPNCLEEIKSLNQLVNDYKGKDVIFIGLATNKKADLEKFLQKNPFAYNIVPSATQAILSFGEPDKSGAVNIPFPMHVVIDREGAIVVRKSGRKGLDDVKNELKKQIESAPKKTE